ncbi:MAG: LytTR family DNA-binding domain-containing protein [Bacteroidota bacterium]
MRAYRVLLVDDEYLALKLLENFIKELPELEVVASVKSPIEALDLLNRSSIDILFLDVQMPTLSGVNLLKSLPKRPATIFTTAYAEHAVDAFDLDAVDYLLKPFAFERFLQAVNKAKDHLQHSSEPNRTLSAGRLDTTTAGHKDFITIKADTRLVKVPHQELLFIEGLKEYAKLTTEKENLICLERLKNLEAQLPAYKFMRFHKSFIVNLTKVTAMEGNRLEIKGHLIPVSREKKKEVMERLF